jgi:hypothetical protein
MIIVNRTSEIIGNPPYDGGVYMWFLGGHTAAINPWTSTGETSNSGTFLYEPSISGYVWVNAQYDGTNFNSLDAGNYSFALTRTHNSE